MTDALAAHAAAQLVPASYAEKTMASLMQLHTELMDEKERRVELFRQLMEREQALAELKMYVKLLEERVAPPRSAAATVQAVEPVPPAPPPRQEARAPTPRVPPVPPRAAARPRPDGWKTW